jgi:serine/threonine-protein kinase
MEHVPGHSCAELLRDRGHLDLDQGVEVVTQACRGLDYAHRNGVVHRDVKPGNLLVSDADVVKLADFGIARATDQSSITQVGSVLGTAAYLAPEQARGEEAGARADLYSLGVVAYQLLSGRLPYEATSLSELALKQQRESPIPLDQLNTNVPHELAQAVASALAIDQESRPADAMILAESIRNGAQGLNPFPAGAPTAHLGTDAATSVLPAGADQRTAATRIAQRPPPGTARTAPARGPRALEPQRPARPGAAPAAAAQRSPRGTGRAFRRLMALLVLAILFTAAVAIAVVIATSTSNSVVHFRTVVAHDAQSAINAVRNIISGNTK